MRYGLHYMYSDDNRFEGNVFRDNAAGAALMSSSGIVLRRNRFLASQGHRSYGVLLQTVEGSTLEENEISGNTIGVFFESGHGNRLTGNRIDRNHIGIHVSDSSDGNQFAGNRFVGNLHTVETTGGNLTSQWAVGGRGNYWDGAVAIDLDRNGIADLPHRELDLFGALRRELPAIGLLSGSPAERLLRFVHARLALPGLPGVVDPAPLTNGSPTHDHDCRPDQIVRRPPGARLARPDARPGEVTLLVGANGCGKTTTLRQLCGLSTPDAGRVVIGSVRSRRRPVRRRWRSSRSCRRRRASTRDSRPERFLAFYARLRGSSPARIGAVEAQWDLAAVRSQSTGRLSGGTRQRLGLAVLSLPDAPVLVLDEPGLSLDPHWRRRLQAELRASARRGATVLVATHLLGEWNGHADRCLVLERGRVERELPPTRLLEAFPFARFEPAYAQAG